MPHSWSLCLPVVSFALAAAMAGIPTSSANAIGALAIDGNQGDRYGYSYDYRTKRSAMRRALKECARKNCEVVLIFRNGCAAYAADQLPGARIGGGSSGHGSREAAEEAAHERCALNGGILCKVRVSACD